MRIAIDAMGGDHAPAATVLGGIEAARIFKDDCEIVFVGNEQQIKDEIDQHFRTSELNLSIQHAEQIVEMKDAPTIALRQKKNSSISIAMNMHANKEVDAVISAGNTGAAMASAVKFLGRINKVMRPAIGTLIPHINGVTLLLDAGANMDCKPEHLLQFGVMGSIFYNHLFDCDKPRVGLLSVGEEDSKGNSATIEANKLLRKSQINFIGNVEGSEVLRGNYNVVICDGFIGNIMVKFAESIDKVYRHTLRRKIGKKIISQFGAFLLKPTFDRLRKIFDYQEYGGAPLLGVQGICIICHGKSSPRAIKNAVREAVKLVRENVNIHIAKELL